MTRLRQLMLEELHRRNYADSTIRVYIRTVEYFNQYFRRPPCDPGQVQAYFQGSSTAGGGPGSVWSQPARQVHDDKCRDGAACIIVVYFHGKLDFKPVDMKAQ